VRRALLGLAVVAVLAASALALGSSAAPAAGRKCIPDKQAGIQVVNKTTVIVYCGHADGTLKGTIKTTKYTKGACLKTVGNVIVGFGKFTTSRHPIALFDSFYLVTPATKDGTYRVAVLHVQRKGKKETIANNVRVVFKDKLSRGTFSGKFTNGLKFTGFFTCK
jgi:hypothetical protein